MDYLYISVCNNHNKHDVVQHTAGGPFQTTVFAPTTPSYALCVKNVSVKVLKCTDVTGMEHTAKGRRQWESEGNTGGYQERKGDVIGQKEERQ